MTIKTFTAIEKTTTLFLSQAMMFLIDSTKTQSSISNEERSFSSRDFRRLMRKADEETAMELGKADER